MTKKTSETELQKWIYWNKIFLEFRLKFDKFWHLLHTELQQSKDFTTLVQQKKFIARSEYNRNGEQVIRIIPDSGKQRGAIAHYEFEGIWDNAKGYPMKLDL